MKNDQCYQAIYAFYYNQFAKRSGVPYINHIDEGLVILDEIGAEKLAKHGYCMHPLVQSDETLIECIKEVDKKEVVGMLGPVILAMEYRAVANAYLLKHYKGKDDKIKLSPVKHVNDMLIADKVQNRKDFELYHYGKYERSEDLLEYFRNWLSALGVSEKRYLELSAKIKKKDMN